MLTTPSAFACHPSRGGEWPFLTRLLAGAEVAWVELGDVFRLKNGYTPSKLKPEYWSDGDIPWLRMEDLRLNGSILNAALQHVHASGVKGDLFPAHSIIMATTATIGEHALVTVDYLSNQRFTNFTVKDEFKSTLNTKFIYYYFFIIGEKAKRSVNISSFPSVQMSELKKWEFPIPCPDNPEKSLAIQGEIVRILDTFTELTTELTTELDARKKQYSYYRDQLLNFDHPVPFIKKLLAGAEVRWKELKDTLVRTKGTRITAAQMKILHKDDAPVKIFAGGKTISFVNFEDIPEKDINWKPSIIVKSRGIIEFEYYDKPFSHKNEMWSYHSGNDCLSIKYVYYFLKLNESYFQGLASRMQMPQIATPDTDKYKIPIPCPDNPEKSLAIQGEIVRILDQFDTLTQSISEGLPREIRLRQQQYAYYRDLLLKFP